MDLTVQEQLALALYLEFYGKCYNLTDTRTNGIKENAYFTRHIEMESMYFLLQEANINIGTKAFGYNCYMEYNRIHLPDLLKELLEMDVKEGIEAFYVSYCERREKISLRTNNYVEQLKELLVPWNLKDSEIAKIVTISYALKDILKEEEGCMIVATIMYHQSYMYRHEPQTFEYFAVSLTHRGYNVSIEFIEHIWNILQIIGLVGIASKKETPKELMGQAKKFVPSENE